jgi:hypothetical protein
VRPILLPLNGAEVVVVLDALVSFALEREAADDPCREAPVADVVADRVRRLQDLELEASRQALLALGLGVSRGRPQG